jgi:alpha-1,3-rhamnosyl/mannosyltransferase
MKIGIDFRPALYPGAGIGRYARELCRALPPLLGEEDELALFGVAYTPPRLDPGGLEALTQSSAVRLVQKRFPGRLLNLLGRFGVMGVERFTGPLDLYHHTDFVYAPLKRTPCTLVIFDLLFMEKEKYNTAAFCRDLRKRVRRALNQAAGVVVPTREVQRSLDVHFPGLEALTRVVPLGGDHLPEGRAMEGEGAPKPGRYLLSVGTLEPRKNRARLLEAFAAAAKDHPGIELVVVGRPGWMDEAFQEGLKTSSVRDRVRVIRDLPDPELRWLYEHALALAYPSLAEGFGLPIVEAMAAGCPVLTSHCSAMPEVAGGAALEVDPRDVDDMAHGLKRLIEEESLRDALRQAGRDRAARFTWKGVAGETLAFLREVARDPH